MIVIITKLSLVISNIDIQIQTKELHYIHITFSALSK